MSVDACADLVAKGDPDRFQAVMAAPVATRARLLPLYAFNLEAARAPWVTQEAMIAEMRLQWWRDALEEIAKETPVRRHEVVTPLAEVLSPRQARLLDGLVEARRWDIYRDPFEDQAAFDAHIDATSGTLMWVSAQLLGAADAGQGAIRAYAYAAGVAAWLRAVPELEARGRIPLLDGRPEGVVALAERALAQLETARSLRAKVPAQVRPALLAGWQAEGVLKVAAARPACVAEGRLGLSEFRRRGGLLWQALSGRW